MNMAPVLLSGPFLALWVVCASGGKTESKVGDEKATSSNGCATATLRIGSHGFRAMEKPLEKILNRMATKVVFPASVNISTSSGRQMSIIDMKVASYKRVSPLSLCLRNERLYKLALHEQAVVRFHVDVVLRPNRPDCTWPVIVTVNDLSMNGYIQVTGGSTAGLLNPFVTKCDAIATDVTAEYLDQWNLPTEARTKVISSVQYLVRSLWCKLMLYDIHVALQHLKQQLPITVPVLKHPIPIVAEDETAVERLSDGSTSLKIPLRLRLPNCSIRQDPEPAYASGSEVLSVTLSEQTLNAVLKALFSSMKEATESDGSVEVLESEEQTVGDINEGLAASVASEDEDGVLKYTLVSPPRLQLTAGMIALKANGLISSAQKTDCSLAANLSADVTLNMEQNSGPAIYVGKTDPDVVDVLPHIGDMLGISDLRTIVNDAIVRAISRLLGLKHPETELSFLLVKGLWNRIVNKWLVLYADIELMPDKLLEIARMKGKSSFEKFLSS